MRKYLGAALLVAGTCIGSSLVAVPMLLSKVGLLPSAVLMCIIWWVMYHTALISLELNLQAGKGLSLGDLGRHFSGPIAGFIGDASIIILSYSVLSLFIYGGSSVLRSLMSFDIEMTKIMLSVTALSIICVSYDTKIIDYINRILFSGLVVSIVILLTGMIMEISWSELPLTAKYVTDISVWRGVVTGVFVSFGFQVIFHSLTNYCNKNPKELKKAFLIGSLIPAIVSFIWTTGVIGVIYSGNKLFYHNMINGHIDVGELITMLDKSSKWAIVQFLVWCFSILAATTSILGVGLGLCDSFKKGIMVKLNVHNHPLGGLCAAALAIVPAGFTAIIIPDAFFTLLGFAGMVLVIIAILLPMYLFQTNKFKKLHYPLLKNKILLFFSLFIGVLIVVNEITDILSS